MSYIKITRETHETPRAVAEALTAAGGVNIYGEPRFRAIWGRCSFDWIGGEFIDYDDAGRYLRTTGDLRFEPRYSLTNPDRWYIECWLPPETFGARWRWERELETSNGRAIPQLGPFPSRGKYETALCLERDGEFVQITPSICREFVKRVRFSKQFSYKERLAAIQAREARKQADIDRVRHDILWDENQFYKGSYVTVGGEKEIYRHGIDSGNSGNAFNGFAAQGSQPHVASAEASSI